MKDIQLDTLMKHWECFVCGGLVLAGAIVLAVHFHSGKKKGSLPALGNGPAYESVLSEGALDFMGKRLSAGSEKNPFAIPIVLPEPKGSKKKAMEVEEPLYELPQAPGEKVVPQKPVEEPVARKEFIAAQLEFKFCRKNGAGQVIAVFTVQKEGEDKGETLMLGVEEEDMDITLLSLKDDVAVIQDGQGKKYSLRPEGRKKVWLKGEE